MEELNLGGAWEFREAGTSGWNPAQVPGCNYNDLLALQKIPDPFLGENEKDVLWVAQKDWEYQRSFQVPAAFLQADKILLACAQLDTLCELFLNGVQVGSGENTHIRYEFDVKSTLREGENELRVVFHSPLAYIKQRQDVDKSPFNTMGLTGAPHMRKPQCHFGWDWGPILPISGITGDIALRAFGACRLADARISQKHAENRVTLAVEPAVEQFEAAGFSLECTLLSPAGAVIETKSQQDAASPFVFLIDRPELWWTADLSDKPEQPLYTVSLSLKTGDREADSLSKKIGLRTIELNRDPDEYGTNFQFRVNGVPIFAKGTNYIPPDSLITRFATADKDVLLRDCLRAHMNMVRIWGGGYYETDEFYDLCDRYGLLVWQDFCFACKPYPFYTEPFLENVKAEIADNVRRLRHHASLALWCGNNELETMSIGWKPYRKLTQWTKIFFYDILPGLVRAEDGATPFISGSPIGTDYMKGFGSDSDGDTHLWQVWHGLKKLTYYRKRMTRFCSEFGLESMPSMDMIRVFSEPKDYALTSKVFNAHQKSPSGNQKMLFYMAEKYRVPTEFTDLIYLSQMIQLEGVRDATEHWRRNRGRCNGSLYWQLNDCWPVNSWASIDYLGRYKALQFGARRFLAPVLVSLEDTKKQIRVFVVNDKREPFHGTLQYRVLDFTGKVLAKGEQEVTVPETCAEAIQTLSVDKLLSGHSRGDAVLVVDLLHSGALVSRQTHLFDYEKNIALPDASVDVSARVENGTALITLKSDRFARSLFVESACVEGNFSDNFFDLLPGEPVTVTAAAKPGVTADQLRGSVRSQSVGSMKRTKSRLAGKWTRFKILMRPINLAQRLFS